jgi:hypothetical protein
LTQQLQQIEAIWPFLQLPPLKDERIEYYLSPEKVKINSLETYQMIPNAQEIEDKCGSDRTGWLFKGWRSTMLANYNLPIDWVGFSRFWEIISTPDLILLSKVISIHHQQFTWTVGHIMC